MADSTAVSRPLDLILANPELAGSQTEALNQSICTTKLSRRRWAILFAVTLFGFTDSLLDEISPILQTILALLDLPLKKYVYISQIFGYVALVNTIPSAWLIDRYGIKATMYGATVVMIFRNFFKALLFSPDLPGWSQYKLVYWAITGIASVQTLSLFYCVPLKISESWFSTSERSLAWTVMISSTSMGISIAAFVYPRIVHQVMDVKALAYLNIICAVVVTIAVLLCITRSEPEHSPNERVLRSSVKSIPYLKTLGSVFKHKNIVIHLFHVAISAGVIITIATLIQDILLSSNHSRVFVGNLVSLTSVLSLISTLWLSIYVHKYQDITFVCKAAAFMSTLLAIVRLYSLVYPFPESIVIGTTVLYCIALGWSMPNFNNMTAHLICGTVSQATISGLAAMIVIVIVSLCRTTFVSLMRVVDGKSDYTYSFIFVSALTGVSTFIYLVVFDGKPPKADEDEDEANEDLS